MTIRLDPKQSVSFEEFLMSRVIKQKLFMGLMRIGTK
jgi:hypothetical protein